jgi:hypothetical protein
MDIEDECYNPWEEVREVDDKQLKVLNAVVESEKATGDWASKPAIPASTVAATNTEPDTMWVEVTGGTVTVVKVDNVTVGARVSGAFLVRPGSTIALTYSVAPTWQWFRQ